MSKKNFGTKWWTLKLQAGTKISGIVKIDFCKYMSTVENILIVLMKKLSFLVVSLLSVQMAFADGNRVIDSLKLEMEKTVTEQDWQKLNKVMWSPGWNAENVPNNLDFKGAIKLAYTFYKEYKECKPVLEQGENTHRCVNVVLENCRGLESRTHLFSKSFKSKIDADIKEMKELAQNTRDQELNRVREKNRKENEWRRIGIRPSEVKHWEELGLNVESAEEWLEQHQSLYDIKAWLKNGVATVDSAKLWIGLGVTSRNIDKWASIGLEQTAEWLTVASPETDVSVYVQAGANPKNLKGWLDPSYSWGVENFSESVSYEDVTFFNKNEVPPSFAIAMKSLNLKNNEIARQWKNVKKQCKIIYPLENLQSENPYATKGKCYEYTGTSIQLLSKNSGLFDGEVLSFVSVSSGIIPKSVVGIVKSSGAYIYKSTRGAKETVPNLKLIQFVPYVD